MNYRDVDCHISTFKCEIANERRTIAQKSRLNTDGKEFTAFI